MIVTLKAADLCHTDLRAADLHDNDIESCGSLMIVTLKAADLCH